MGLERSDKSRESSEKLLVAKTKDQLLDNRDPEFSRTCIYSKGHHGFGESTKRAVEEIRPFEIG